MLRKIQNGITDNLTGTVVGDVASAIRRMKPHIHLGEQVFTRAQVFAMPVASQRVMTWGCSHKSSTSGIAPALRSLHEVVLQLDSRRHRRSGRDRQPSRFLRFASR